MPHGGDAKHSPPSPQRPCKRPVVLPPSLMPATTAPLLEMAFRQQPSFRSSFSRPIVPQAIHHRMRRTFLYAQTARLLSDRDALKK